MSKINRFFFVIIILNFQCTSILFKGKRNEIANFLSSDNLPFGNKCSYDMQNVIEPEFKFSRVVADTLAVASTFIDLGTGYLITTINATSSLKYVVGFSYAYISIFVGDSFNTYKAYSIEYELNDGWLYKSKTDCNSRSKVLFKVEKSFYHDANNPNCAIQKKHNDWFSSEVFKFSEYFVGTDQIEKEYYKLNLLIKKPHITVSKSIHGECTVRYMFYYPGGKEKLLSDLKSHNGV
ncbi:hypothetical protein [Leptospira idonii]|uniref:Uncharacterized protein n=1 Tax=Leptospira idonii TaxID=1193500 RepID=A0A4R9M4K4_9LEPT|nr:hypothetical protein [Leptospira idonii]TGN19678.1 hypothetical protein EHS15_07825 [Leptospira idonii]